MFNKSYQIRSILRIAWLELRAELTGGLEQFRVFLISLALGISAITAVGSLNSAMQAGIKADTKKILGGDVELRLSHQPASPNQFQYLKLNSEKLSQWLSIWRNIKSPISAKELIDQGWKPGNKLGSELTRLRYKEIDKECN